MRSDLSARVDLFCAMWQGDQLRPRACPGVSGWCGGTAGPVRTGAAAWGCAIPQRDNLPCCGRCPYFAAPHARRIGLPVCDQSPWDGDRRIDPTVCRRQMDALSFCLDPASMSEFPLPPESDPARQSTW